MEKLNEDEKYRRYTFKSEADFEAWRSKN